MDSATVLPVMKAEIGFEHDGMQMKMLVYTKNEPSRKFARCNGRWRRCPGLYVSPHSIASEIFEYRERPTIDEMEFMGDYVRIIGEIVDAACAAITEGVERRMAVRLEREIVNRTGRTIDEMLADQEAEQRTFVYLMSHVNGLTKIGMSKKPHAREKTLQAEDPRLNILASFEAFASTEKRLHEIFDSARVRGEWFDLKPRHIEWIVAVLRSTTTDNN